MNGMLCWIGPGEDTTWGLLSLPPPESSLKLTRRSPLVKARAVGEACLRRLSEDVGEIGDDVDVGEGGGSEITGGADKLDSAKESPVRPPSPLKLLRLHVGEMFGVGWITWMEMTPPILSSSPASPPPTSL